MERDLLNAPSREYDSDAATYGKPFRLILLSRWEILQVRSWGETGSAPAKQPQDKSFCRVAGNEATSVEYRKGSGML